MVRKNANSAQTREPGCFGGRVDDIATERRQGKGGLESQVRNEPEKKVWIQLI